MRLEMRLTIVKTKSGAPLLIDTIESPCRAKCARLKGGRYKGNGTVGVRASRLCVSVLG